MFSQFLPHTYIYMYIYINCIDEKILYKYKSTNAGISCITEFRITAINKRIE